MRRLWVSLAVLASLVVVVVLLSRAGRTSRSHRGASAIDEQRPGVQNVDPNVGQKTVEAGHEDGDKQTRGLWSKFYQLEGEESVELAPMLAQRVRRLELLHDAGRIGTEAVLIARIEEALGRIVSAPLTERWQMLHSTDDWARAVRERTQLLHEAGRLSNAERDQAERALQALRTGETWLLSPRRLAREAATDLAPAVAAPAEEGDEIANVRARHLKRQIEALEEATEPELAILRLLLRARLGEMSFEVARAEAEHHLARAHPATRGEAEALVALFDWYGWARVRELDSETR